MLRTLNQSGDPLTGASILLVDDDLRNCFALSKQLKREGIKVIVADSGALALKKLGEAEYVDLILTDIMMPEMDGYQRDRGPEPGSSRPRVRPRRPSGRIGNAGNGCWPGSRSWSRWRRSGGYSTDRPRGCGRRPSGRSGRATGPGRCGPGGRSTPRAARGATHLAEARAAPGDGIRRQAEQSLRRAIAADPADPEPWKLLLEILRVEDRTLDAQEVGWESFDRVPAESRRDVLRELTLAILADLPDERSGPR